MRVITVNWHIKMRHVLFPQRIEQSMYLFGFAKATVVKKIVDSCFISDSPSSSFTNINNFCFRLCLLVLSPNATFKHFIPLEHDCYYGNCSNKNKYPLADFDFSEFHKSVNKRTKGEWVEPAHLFNSNLLVTTLIKENKKQLRVNLKADFT